MSNEILNQLERDILADEPISRILQKVLLFEGHVNSEELSRWARAELHGYTEGQEVPAYRTINVGYYMDYANGPRVITAQPLPLSHLPKFFQDNFGSSLTLREPIGEIEHYGLQEYQSERKGMRLFTLPGSDRLARYFEKTQGDMFFQISSIYRGSHPAQVVGIVEQVRTRLVEIISGIRSVSSPGEPTQEQVQRVVQVVIHGDATNVNINTAIAGENGDNAITSDILDRSKS